MRKGNMMNVSKNLGVVIISSTKIEIMINRERFSKCAQFRYISLAQKYIGNKDILIENNL